MNRSVPLLLLLLLTLAGFNLSAQQAKADTEHKAVPKKIFRPNVYLGKSDYYGGPIQKSVFDNLMKQGLTSRDSTGKKYKVVSFDFTYAERNLYEDSVGNLMVVPEYMSGHCDGDTLTAGISSAIYELTKAGDTAYIDNVLVVRYQNKTDEPMPVTSAFLGKGMKFVITK